MADVAFVCPKCGHTYEFAAHLAGKRGRCKTCQTIFRIPSAPAPPSAARGAAVPASSATAATGPLSRSSSPPPATSISTSRPPARAADEGKIVFNCAACGHGYRLDAKLAGKQGRCTSCRAVFTIPSLPRPARPLPEEPPPTSPAQWRVPTAGPTPGMVAADPAPARARSRAGATRRAPSPEFGAGVAAPAAARLAADDSGYWELDSSEAIPAAAAHPGAGRPRPIAAATAAAAVRQPIELDESGEGPVITARPIRPKWVTYTATAIGVVGGAVAFSLAYAWTSGAPWPTVPRNREQAGAQPSPSAPPAAVAEAPEPSPGSGPAPPPGAGASGSVDQHRQAVDALIRAYNEIADGYARIRDVHSIPDGDGPVGRAVEQLRSAAQRGRRLPPLSPEDREAVIRHGGPALLRAIDRVLGELRRLKATPGLRSDFDRLIDAYTRARQEVQREIEHR
jgi:hypothetical protein